MLIVQRVISQYGQPSTVIAKGDSGLSGWYLIRSTRKDGRGTVTHWQMAHTLKPLPRQQEA